MVKINFMADSIDSIKYKTAVYPGSFDPITFGHLDVLKRSLNVFDKVIVAVACNKKKSYLFPQDMRIELINRIIKNDKEIDTDRVDVVGLKGLLIKYVESIGAKVIIRGLRAVSDFEYELQLATTNRTLNPDIETIFMMTAEKYSFLSSTIVKEISRLGGDVSSMVPSAIAEELLKIYSKGENDETLM
ncbi:MAG: pantetheine-phosphate adenylyltransferase [Deltaproteobacteria bacterium]|jgi:pantetheine-phosphate adenylyltransferase|nr:pantetheine-phosphate adenylyltransferase [Deltaproteobacteria bacterium]MDA8299696.1 pantetheine-phosphate adenylyltransferase [Deltaproteobacteria bacterium]